jgi:hypothetical protein
MKIILGEWAFQETSLRDSCHCQDGYELLIDNNKNNGLLSRAICKGKYISCSR